MPHFVETLAEDCGTDGDKTQDWVQYCKKTIKVGGKLPKLNISSPETLEKMENQSNHEQELELHVKITPETRRNDIVRSWPQIESKQVELWGKHKKKTRKWRTFERDYFIWNKVRKEKKSYEGAYDMWLSDHPNDIVEITAIQKGVEKIENLRK